MKSFTCGDVVPGCEAVFTAADEEGILAQVADHAPDCPGLTVDGLDLVAAVRPHIHAA
ncbi:MAG TPA: DUF1059 domain-containing protein [Actinomycetes bacterium]|nr:DUF1059 domain-containing protein [Actinomycetes bacterium]